MASSETTRPIPAPTRSGAGEPVPARLSGLVLLGLCGLALLRLHRLATTLPLHQPSLVEMLLSLAALLAGVSGAALLFEGAALFRPLDRRRRSPHDARAR
jgi:hypothetical protein